MELKDAIQNRKSEREFSTEPLTTAELKYLHWAAYKVPSAGALYPLELLICTGGNFVNIGGVNEIPYLIIIAANYEKTLAKYGERGYRYVYMEAGHTAQNIQLMCTEMGLSSCCIGAFNDEEIKKMMQNELPNYHPIYLVAVGRKK